MGQGARELTFTRTRSASAQRTIILRLQKACAAAAAATSRSSCDGCASMDLSCPVCLREDKDGYWFQCDKGHPVCAECYMLDVNHPRHNGNRPKCVLCRDVLKRGAPVLCLDRMKAIAVKKAAAAADEATTKHAVTLAVQEHEELEHAMALSVAEAITENEKAEREAEAEAKAIQWECEQIAQERALKRNQEQAGLEAAYALADAEGGLDEQTKKEAEYEMTAKRVKYSGKLQKVVANAPNRTSMCCTIIEDLLSQLSPSERVLVDAAMAQAAAAAKTTATASSKTVAAMTVPKLRAALKARGLDQSGLKSVLLARLLAEVT